MEIISSFLSELLIIVMSLGLFVFLVGIRVFFPYCGSQCSQCHNCLYDANQETDESNDAESDNPDSQICYNCGVEFAREIDCCPSCGCYLNDEDNKN